MEKKDRRQFIRLSAYHCVKYRLLSAENAEKTPFVSSTVRDIGGGGICLRTDEHLPRGSLIELKINFPHIITSIYAVAQVIWVKKRGKTRRYEVGLQFMEIEELMRKVIDTQIRGVFNRVKRGK